MREAIVFLTIEHIAAIHKRMIDEFGGDSAIRDQGLLESAAGMPGARFERKYLHPTLSEMAAAYLFHICRNHPFVDGNKRTALTAAEIFLLLNDTKLKATNKELEKLTMGIAEGTFSKQQTMEFFKEHVIQT